MSILVTTTGTLGTVPFNDLSGRSLVHPIVDLDISLEYKLEELRDSIDFQAAIDSGYITVTDGVGTPITNVSKLDDNQDSIVGITGTKSQFDTALTDGNFMYIGDAPTSHSHLLAAGATDVTATAAEVNLLDLSGLTIGWVLSADSATTASWKAPTGGITSLNTLTTASQTFVNDTNISMVSAGSTHTITWGGSLAATRGGTGQSTYTVGDLLIGGATNTLTKLADIATGNVLLSGGVGAAPSYGKVGLTTHVTGVLPISAGGTGQDTNTLAFNALSPLTTKGDIIVRNSTSNTRLPVGTAGQVLLVDSAEATGVRWGNADAIAGQTIRFLAANTADSNTVVNSTSEINFTSNGTNYAIPADTMKQYSVLRFLVYGKFSTKSGAVGDLTIRLKIGATVINTNVTSVGSSVTNLGFQFTGQVQVRTAGAGGTLYSHLLCVFNGNSSTPSTWVTTSNGTNAFNTTISNTIQMSAQWANANANNSITIEQATFEILN